MGEPIFKRMQRVVSAGLESATDAAERLNGRGMMRHAVREVEQAIDTLHKRLDAVEASAMQADWRRAAIADQVKQLDDDARFAIEKGREDLAQAAVHRQFALEDEAKALKAAEAEAQTEAVQLRASLEELAERKAQMERDLAAVEAAEREAKALGRDPKTEAKVKRAEEAFDRALRAARVTPGVLHDSPPEIAELRAARREEEIAARMAALRKPVAKKGGAKG